jgi:hypothetical protein
MVEVLISQLFRDFILPVHEGLNLMQLQSDPTTDGYLGQDPIVQIISSYVLTPEAKLHASSPDPTADIYLSEIR